MLIVLRSASRALALRRRLWSGSRSRSRSCRSETGISVIGVGLGRPSVLDTAESASVPIWSVWGNLPITDSVSRLVLWRLDRRRGWCRRWPGRDRPGRRCSRGRCIPFKWSRSRRLPPRSDGVYRVQIAASLRRCLRWHGPSSQVLPNSRSVTVRQCGSRIGHTLTMNGVMRPSGCSSEIRDASRIEVISVNEVVVDDNRAVAPFGLPTPATPTAPTATEVGSNSDASAKAEKEACTSHRIVWDPLESTCRHASLSIL